MAAIHDFEVKTIDGVKTTLKPYQGKVMLIVNVASACGLTPQYKGLQELYNEFHDKGFEVLGFPCNQFGAQEPGTESEIKNFCSTRFDVNFPMFSKIEVNGDKAHPLYQYLKKEKAGKDGNPDIEWNFAKFLVDDQGRVVERFPARTDPSEIKSRVAELLKH
ncbi:glutathione peroxidase [Oligoflexus tunisiensis]|uniref:glutathione peroxidase n=1 Tax=Oligoflexus tunisiensis TaxID=708132 RepID=UPI000A3DEAB3|nr:glutathione peroxidase [Oligoflexus tunisiensis]